MTIEDIIDIFVDHFKKINIDVIIKPTGGWVCDNIKFVYSPAICIDVNTAIIFRDKYLQICYQSEDMHMVDIINYDDLTDINAVISKMNIGVINRVDIINYDNLTDIGVINR